MLKRLKDVVGAWTSPQLAESLAQVYREFRVARVHRRGCLAARAWHGKTGLRINFGCGSALKPGFLNVDLAPAADLRLDLRQPIPLEDGCATLIFSEHFLEHLRYPEDAEQFVGECHRLLEPGGTLLLSVPDAEWSMRDYASGAQDFVEASRQKLHYPREMRTTLEHVNYQFRQRWRGRSEHHFECHRFAYDLETLRHLLTAQGFVEVQRRPFDAAFDKPVRVVDSLFVRAEKSS